MTNKKRIIKMLFVVVLEFFLCWTPLYVINTMALFSPRLVYHNFGYAGISFLQLLAYSSSCCNPITYCFMNSNFRKSFLNLFRCCQRQRDNLAFLGHVDSVAERTAYNSVICADRQLNLNTNPQITITRVP